ncbi:unnamed protein product [Sphagnum jensenii]|uniref:Uncharacterized protein n=1 Tax=Sphagnum jensenii TaxID=128206 RepID=A0ABP0W4F5_9BRYO
MTCIEKVFELRVQMIEQRNTFNFNDPPLPHIPNESITRLVGTCSSKWVTYNNGVIVCVLLLGGICSLFIY